MNLFEVGSTAENYGRYLEPSIFAPWTELLLAVAGLGTGDTVLDVASGTGVVARAVAEKIGPSGRVIASDISPRMLASVGREATERAAAIETLVCSATEIPLDDGSVSAVLCQQGFPFMPDRAAVAREFRRVLAPGGAAAVAVWAGGHRLDPFDAYAEALGRAGVRTEFGEIATNKSIVMRENDVADALSAGGLRDVEVTLERVDIQFPRVADEVNGIFGTPLGAQVVALDAEKRTELLLSLAEQLTGPDGRPMVHETWAVIGRGIA